MLRAVNGECDSCESTYVVHFVDELVSEELPEKCPFCGETIDQLTEENMDEDDDDAMDNQEWDD